MLGLQLLSLGWFFIYPAGRCSPSVKTWVAAPSASHPCAIRKPRAALATTANRVVGFKMGGVTQEKSLGAVSRTAIP